MFRLNASVFLIKTEAFSRNVSKLNQCFTCMLFCTRLHKLCNQVQNEDDED